MRRRTFFKFLAVASVGATARLPFLAAAASAAATRTVSYRGQLYRSDGSGRIYLSSDAGSSWKLQRDLGRSYSVTKLVVDRNNRLNASVGFSGWTFGLVLAPYGSLETLITLPGRHDEVRRIWRELSIAAYQDGRLPMPPPPIGFTPTSVD